MSADYFQDILPPEGEGHSAPPPHAPSPAVAAAATTDPAPERSIRNININRRMAPERREAPFPGKPPRANAGPLSSMKLWFIAIIALLMIGSLSLFLFRKTTVTVTPRTHTIVFDNTAPFTAYPSDAAASGTLPYRVETFTFEDSEVVPAQGTQHVETKASGSITVVNDYSTAPVKLIKDTRFETPDGLIYRTPTEILVPGKKGSTPGTVQVTVVADAVGQNYNVGPIAKFTLPGLKGGAMFNTVYARSSAPFTGGFSGEQPQTAPGALETAQAQVRSRLEQKVREAVGSIASSTTALGDLARLTYSDLPNVAEGESSVRVGERVTAQVPVFDTKVLAGSLAQSVSADAQQSDVRIVPGAGFSAADADIASTTLGTDPIAFTLSGTAQLVWVVDAQALASALAGHDQGAFQTIIGGFPFVQEAKARIEPFWSSSFPKDPTGIEIVVESAPKP